MRRRPHLMLESYFKSEDIIKKVIFVLIANLIFVTAFNQALGSNQIPKNSSNQKIETYFNTPGFTGQTSTVIEDQILKLISQANSNTQINIALYTFNRVPVAIEILKAQARGARIQVVMDGKSKSDSQKPGSAIHALLTGTADLPGLNCRNKNCVTFCSRSCNGLWINHNKFFLFSKLNGEFENQTNTESSHSIVAQTSSNMTEGQLYHYNDLIVVKDDPTFYKGMLDYWKRLNKNSFKFNKVSTIQGQNGIKSYFFPRLIGSDPVLKTLNEVKCDQPESIIRVVQSRFDDSRAYLAKKLSQLSQQGCDVKVIVRDEPSANSPGKKIVQTLRDSIAILPYETETSESQRLNSIHSKIVLIRARMNGSKSISTLVLTGSHNFNLTSLKTNDEVLFKVKDRPTFDAYLNFWNQIADDAGIF